MCISPRAPEGFLATIICDQFIDALQDVDIQIAVRQGRPESIQQALASALEYESIRRAAHVGSNGCLLINGTKFDGLYLGCILHGPLQLGMLAHLYLFYHVPSVQRTARAMIPGAPHAPSDPLIYSSRHLRIDRKQYFPDARLQLSFLSCYPASFVYVLLDKAPQVLNRPQLRDTGGFSSRSYTGTPASSNMAMLFLA